MIDLGTSNATQRLWRAMEAMDFEQITMLISRDSHLLEARNEDGETPLIASARVGSRQLVEFFAERGSDVEAENNSGKTALMVAIRHGHPRVSKYLMRRRPAKTSDFTRRQRLAEAANRFQKSEASNSSNSSSSSSSRSQERPFPGRTVTQAKACRVMGLKVDASAEDIRKARNKLIKNCHPDLAGDSESARRRAQQINEAYTLLSSPPAKLAHK